MLAPDPDLLVTRARDAILAALPDVVAIYVFGSAATGDFAEGSDLDLAVLGPRPYDGRGLYDVARSLETALDVDVDLVDLITAPTLLKFEVIARGRSVYCANRDMALDFEARSLTEYGDYQFRVAPLLEAVRETGRAYAR
jgi:predicted nucleotidyltransferase